MKTSFALLLIAASLAVSACGIVTAPVSVPAAVAQNASFSIKGPVVDQDGKPLDGVVANLKATHHFWTPLKGSTDVYDELLRRVDGSYLFDVRGSNVAITFSKDGYHDTSIYMDADRPFMARVNGNYEWNIGENFPVVLLSTRPGDANLARFNRTISYANYPIADCIALPNVATDGRSGDIVYTGKDAEDPTIFPPGTLYLTLDKEPPQALNAKGDIDPADLDIPHHVTLRIPGRNSGFVRIPPRPGFDPLKSADEAPDAGYLHDLTLTRPRLREMRSASPIDAAASAEYFYFRANDYYGKGAFSWSSRSGDIEFRFDLRIQPYAGNRSLITHRQGS